MTDLISKLKQKIKEADIVSSLIYVNVGLFVITAVIGLITFLFNLQSFSLLNYGKLPASIILLLHSPWTLITYMFLHVDVLHLLFNMLFLYWFGKFFLYTFSARHLRGLYFLGGFVGALFFILSYHIFPALTININHASLLGASAAVLAIVIAVATKLPNQEVRFLFIGAVKLKYIALFVILMDLLMIADSNPGGHIAHLGGAVAGFFFVKQLAKGKDLTKWINVLIDIPLSLQDKFKDYKKNRAKMKIVKGQKKYTKHQQDHDYNYSKKKQSEEIDKILDKIKESGYANLTEEEKKTLFDAGKK